MKRWIRPLFVILALVTILSLTLSACELIDNGNGDSDDDNGNGKNKDKENGKDKDKDKENGMDKEGKITICHKTGSAKNPYVEITVSDDAAKDGHATHESDIIPAPEGGCPATDAPAN